MLKHRFSLQLITLPILLILGSLACQFGQTPPTAVPTSTTDAGQIATMVAATLSAMEPPAPAATPLPPSAVPAATQAATALPTLPPPPTPIPALQIAYQANGDLRLWTEGAGVVNYGSPGSDVSNLMLSSDGQYLTYFQFTAAETVQWWSLNTTTGAFQIIHSPADFGNVVDPDNGEIYPVIPDNTAWLPGSHQILFSERLVVPIGLVQQYDLKQINAENGSTATILAEGNAGGSFSISPDGQWIILISPTQIELVHPDGSNKHTVLVFDAVMTYSEYAYLPKPVWATDSSSFWVSIPSADPLATVPAPSQTIWQIPVNGAPPSSVYTLNTSLFNGGAALVSPAGQWMAYKVTNAGDPNLSDLYLASLDGTQNNLVASGQIRIWGWNPGGNGLAFQQGDLSYYQSTSGALIQMGDVAGVTSIKWIDDLRFVFTTHTELRLQALTEGSSLIDTFPYTNFGPPLAIKP